MSESVFSAAQQQASTLYLPPGPWATVLDCLCAKFTAISREQWLDRIARDRVLDADGKTITPDMAYREGLKIHYFREVPNETPIPVVETILYADEHLVVADKPHFLPVTPAGEYVEQTLLRRLIHRLDNPDLVPLHRIDRHTAGLVLFSANRQTRSAYQTLFPTRRIDKCYEAIAPALPGLEFPRLHESRLVEGEPFFSHAGRAGRQQHADAHRSAGAARAIMALRAAPGDGQEASVARAHGGAGRCDLQ